MTQLCALLVFALGLAPPTAALASNCYAFVEGVPGVRYAALGDVAARAREVTITNAGHSTFRIETEQGVVIATDYFGASGEGPLPDVVTMNKAHETHFTDFPDPAIPHVLRGWNPAGTGPAEHLLTLRDVTIRNVTTDREFVCAAGSDLLALQRRNVEKMPVNPDRGELINHKRKKSRPGSFCDALRCAAKVVQQFRPRQSSGANGANSQCAWQMDRPP
jgi:hypothetical protein